MNSILSKISSRKTFERRATREGSSLRRSNELCPDCYHVITTISTTRVERTPPLPLSKYSKTRLELISSNCKLCQFAGSLKPEGCEDRGGQMRSFSIYSLNPDFADYDYDTSSALLVFQTKKPRGRLGGNGTFGLLHANFTGDYIKPRLIEPLAIEFSIPREWLSFCKEHHTRTCQPLKGDMVPGFRLLDCMTKRVIRPDQNFEYVCLSYVWGHFASTETDATSFPQTIEDAILVTLYMGFQYLWVDKYCIDQTNESEKLVQIQNMDKIYSMASLTIVAAAGNGPDYGLPGVGSRARDPQKRLVLNDIELIQVYSDTDDVRRSPWASRAWTLQEGYLAKKRLIFTDREVLFLCDRMYCQESVSQKLHHRILRTWDGLDGSHLFGVIPNSHREYFNADRILTEYTARTLSYDSDALNACAGILKAASIRHWYGMPIECDINGKEYTINLQWRNKTQGPQRSNFPSWSWTSINSGKVFPQSKNMSVEHCNISLLTNGNQWIPVDDWVQNGSDFRSLTLSTSLRVSGYIGKPKIVSAQSIHQIRAADHYTNLRPTGNNAYLWAVFPIPPRRSIQGTLEEIADSPLSPIERVQGIISFKLLLDVEVSNPTEFFSDTIALLVQVGMVGPPRTYTVLLLLKPFGEFYRRVGITNWDLAAEMSKRTGSRFKESSEKVEIQSYLEKQTIHLE